MQKFSFVHSCEWPVNKQASNLCYYRAEEIQDPATDELL